MITNIVFLDIIHHPVFKYVGESIEKRIFF
jgi:hypothetical protein